MRWAIWAAAAVVCALSSVARAQPTISMQVTQSNASFDIRAVDPAGTAYALNLSRSFTEIWASTDDARTFAFRGSSPLGDFKIMTSLSDGTLLAETQNSSGFHIVRSTDHGATWQGVLALGQYELLSPHNIVESVGTVYLLEYQTFTQDAVPIHLWASTDGGATWSLRFTFQGHRHGHAIRVDQFGNLYAFFGDTDPQVAILRSSDGGATWTTVLAGTQAARVNDTVFLSNGDLLYGQDIPNLPLRPQVIRMTPSGVQTPLAPLPGPSYSIHEVPTGGYLLGTTREPTGDIYPPGEISAHLFGSANGTDWVELGAYPRRDPTDYARADVFWVLRTGEMVLNLRNVTTLSSGRGFQLLRITTGAGAPFHFEDNFDACTSTTNLGSNWDILGTWYCKAQRARGENGPGTALAHSPLLGDTDVSALVQLNGSTGSGIVARASGNTSYYAVRLVVGQGLELIKVAGGTTTVLATFSTSVLDVTSYTLRLTATGSSPVVLNAFLNGAAVMQATDSSSSQLTSGHAGLLSGTGFRTQYDNFVMDGTAVTGQTPVNFADNFDACTSTTNLGSNWSIIAGTWYCKAQRARGENGPGIVLANTTALGDTDVSALVQLNGSTGSGIVARASGNTSYYAVRLVVGQGLELIKVAGGTTTILATFSTSVLDVTSYTLRLTATGSSPVVLNAFLSGAAVMQATDSSSSQLASGRAGLLSGNVFRTQYDNFVLSSTTTPQPFVSFSDNFDACTSTVDLGPNWSIVGRWYCKAMRARGESASGLALVKANLNPEQIVQAKVQLNVDPTGLPTTATGSGIVARASTSHYYAARIFIDGHFDIVRVDNGVVTVLGSVPHPFVVDISSIIQLRVQGTTAVDIEASIDGVPAVSAVDSSAERLLTGSAGLLSGPGGRSQFDDFSVTAP